MLVGDVDLDPLFAVRRRIGAEGDRGRFRGLGGFFLGLVAGRSRIFTRGWGCVISCAAADVVDPDRGHVFVVVEAVVDDTQAQGVIAVVILRAVECGQLSRRGDGLLTDGEEMGLALVAVDQQVELPFAECGVSGHPLHTYGA